MAELPVSPPGTHMCLQFLRSHWPPDSRQRGDGSRVDDHAVEVDVGGGGFSGHGRHDG